MTRTYTEGEAKALAVEAAREALALFNAQPTEKAYTIAGAAKVLGVSPRTVARLNLPRNAAGRIPYDALLERKVSR